MLLKQMPSSTFIFAFYRIVSEDWSQHCVNAAFCNQQKEKEYLCLCNIAFFVKKINKKIHASV